MCFPGYRYLYVRAQSRVSKDIHQTEGSESLWKKKTFAEGEDQRGI